MLCSPHSPPYWCWLIMAEPSERDEDLSDEIARTVERRPGDQVRCVRVYGRRYRCNWWSAVSSADYDNPSMKGGQLGTAHTIRKSQFLEVTRDGAAGLSIRILDETGVGHDNERSGPRAG